MDKLTIGFIGQGYVGKNLADDFVERGFDIVRYSLDPEHVENKDHIQKCDIVFIAVPTPTTPDGFDDSIMRKEIKLVGKGKLAVIKSTIIPGTTESLQNENSDIFVLHSPEFLVAARAREDTKNPNRNLIGLPIDTKEHREKAQLVLSILPKAPYNKITLSKETELIKYIGNNFLFTKVVFMNLMYDLAQKIGADWEVIREAVTNDPRIGDSHMMPEDETGRGAGGHCLVKDFEALIGFYRDVIDDEHGLKVLEVLRDKNKHLLVTSKKDLHILEKIYGEQV